MKQASLRLLGSVLVACALCIAPAAGVQREIDVRPDGFGPWEFGMRHFQVARFEAFGPYLPVERTGGLETHNGEFEGQPAKISFLFDELALETVEVSIYLGDDVDAMQAALFRTYRYLADRYGELMLGEARLVAGLDEDELTALIPAAFTEPLAGGGNASRERNRAVAPLQRIEMQPVQQPDGANVLVLIDRAERRRVTTVALLASRDGDARPAPLRDAVEGTSGRVEVVNTTNYLRPRLAGIDEYTGRAEEAAVLTRYPELHVAVDARIVELPVGPLLAVAAIVGDFSGGFELHVMPPAVPEPTVLRFARDDQRYVTTASLTAHVEGPDGSGASLSYPVSLRLVLDPEDALEHVRVYPFARRRGVVNVDGRDMRFEITGDSGIFNGWYDRVCFDLDGNGVFDRARNSSELVRVYEGYFTLDGVNWQFDVDRFGDKVSVAPLEGDFSPRATLDEGAMAPDFGFADAGGVERRLSDYRGRLVLLDFWGAWCGPCRGEAPHLVEAYERYRDDGFEIIGIDYNDSVDRQTEFMERYGMTWPQVRESDSYRPIHDLFRNGTWPTHYLIGEDGRVMAFNPRGGKVLELLEEHYGR